MRLNPLRRSQLVTPFGPGAIHVLEGGVAVVTGALDEWFRDRKGNHADEEDLKKLPLWLREPRLEASLGVSHFRMAPGPEDREDANELELTTPVYRFPTWYVCPRCSAMKKADLNRDGYLTCGGTDCKNLRLRQISFAAVCDHGHLQDFPWLEWVHHTDRPDPACAGHLKFMAQGTGSLEAIQVRCELCKKSRSLAGVMSGELPSGSDPRGWSGLSRQLLLKKGDSSARDGSTDFNCQGGRSWMGPVVNQICTRPLRAILINSTNAHYADVRSAIFIPPRYQPSPSTLRVILADVDFRNRIRDWRKADLELEDIVRQLRKKDKRSDCPKLEKYTDADVLSALEGHEEAPPPTEPTTSPASGTRAEQEAVIRRAEYYAFQGETDRAGDLVLRATDASALPVQLAGLIDRVVAVEKLKETRVFAGFSRLIGRPPQGAPHSSSMLWQKYPQDYTKRWLPASVVHGEGVFLRFSEKKLAAWEARPDVIKHIDVLQENHDACVRRYRWEEQTIEPRFVLLHTFAHLLINRMVFECGYGSASLRERLYVSKESEPMAGILIYTAAGDSEGTMGGLVRLAEPEALGRIFLNAIDEADWCSADPVCREAAASGGQGPESLNLAACHSCALLPETSCESFNKYLDRTLVIDPVISIFKNQ
jgi:hypothetical protein